MTDNKYEVMLHLLNSITNSPSTVFSYEMFRA